MIFEVGGFQEINIFGKTVSFIIHVALKTIFGYKHMAKFEQNCRFEKNKTMNCDFTMGMDLLTPNLYS